jgi:hypothetical protein
MQVLFPIKINFVWVFIVFADFDFCLPRSLLEFVAREENKFSSYINNNFIVLLSIF